MPAAPVLAARVRNGAPVGRVLVRWEQIHSSRVSRRFGAAQKELQHCL